MLLSQKNVNCIRIMCENSTVNSSVSRDINIEKTLCHMLHLKRFYSVDLYLRV